MTTITADRLVPLLDVRDMTRTIAFYVDGLGFEKQSEWIKDGKLRWAMLEYPGGAQLMVQERDTSPPADLNAAPVMYVFCNDAPAFHTQVSSRGIETEEPFIGNGMHVVPMVDPDGYRISFESPTDEPDTE